MAVSGMPNSRFLLRSLKLGLKTIDKDKYYVKVADVYIPNYPPGSPSMWIPDAPSLHIWVAESGLAESLIGLPMRTLIVVIGGVVKANDEIQERMIELAESVRAYLLWTWAISQPPDLRVEVIEADEGINYGVEKLEGGGYAGLFLSKWRIVYAFPSTAG